MNEQNTENVYKTMSVINVGKTKETIGYIRELREDID